MFIKITNGIPETYTIGQLRRDNPNTSFPHKIDMETLAEYGVYPLAKAPKPTYDELTEIVKQGYPAPIAGVWTETWEKVQIPLTTASQNVRGKRNSLLAESDWAMLPDSPVDQQAWEAYRKALRDLPSQSGFPYDITWPTKPE